MRALVQRVASASVAVDGEVIAAIDRGLLVLLGIRDGDGADEASWVVRKLLGLRVFSGPSGPMDLSVGDVDGSIVCVSQFTLYGDARRGNRPSLAAAARPEVAEPLYDQVVKGLGAQGGRFGAHMDVSLVNDGPVTLLIESPGG